MIEFMSSPNDLIESKRLMRQKYLEYPTGALSRHPCKFSDFGHLLKKFLKTNISKWKTSLEIQMDALVISHFYLSIQ